MTIALSDNVYGVLCASAEEMGTTRAEIIRRALALYQLAIRETHDREGLELTISERVEATGELIVKKQVLLS